MKTEKNLEAIRSILAEAKTALENQIKTREEKTAAETETQTAKARTKLLEAMDEPEKLSPRDAKAKAKRDRSIVAVAAGAGALVGAVALIATLCFPPVALIVGSYSATLLGQTALASASTTLLTGGLGLVMAACSTAIGYGVGILQTHLTPFIPKLATEQIDDIKQKAAEKIETEITGSVLCQLRLQRSEGKIGHQEFAEVCEALYDLAILQHKIPEAIAQKFRQSAQESRTIFKEEQEQRRAEDKLQLEEKKVEKQEVRIDKKEDLTLEQVKEEMELRRLELAAKIAQSNQEHPLKGILSGVMGGGEEANKQPVDLSRLAMMQMLFGQNGFTGKQVA